MRLTMARVRLDPDDFFIAVMMVVMHSFMIVLNATPSQFARRSSHCSQHLQARPHDPRFER